MTRVDITPPQGLELSGYPHYPRYNTGMHDPLYAACMYLNNGENEAVLVSLDLLFYEREYICEIRERVERAVGIKAENITISTSHTHSGPQTFAVTEESTPELREYTAWTIEAIANAIIDAKNNAFDASFTAGTAMCGAESGVGGNRRFRGGPHDPLVTVMAIKDTSGNIRGALVNYTLHPPLIHEWTEVCTSDYPGYLKLEVEESIPGILVGFTQGASGNQSSRYYRSGESFDEAERVGRTLGRAAVSVLKNLEWKSELDIKVATSSVPMEFRDMGTEEELMAQVARDTAVYKELYAKYGNSTNRDEYYLWQNANLKCLGSEDRLELIRVMNTDLWKNYVERESPAEIHAIALDDLCVVGVPGEVFVEYALYIKAMAGFAKVIVNTNTNGCLPGYLYTPESLLTGGYETDNSVLSEEFGQNLVNEAIRTIKTIRK